MSSAVAKAFSSAARGYDDSAALQVQVGRWLLQALEPVDALLDVGCGTGYMAQQLKQAGLAQRVVGLDCAWQMLAQQVESYADSLVCADMAAPPFAAHSFDGITANLALQWTDQPQGLLMALLPLLKPGGRLSFTVPAPGSLCELQQSWERAGDGHQHINKFNTAEQWEAFGLSALQQLGLQGQVSVEQQAFVRWFDSPRLALQSLRDVGANRVTRGARSGLTGKSQFKAMLQAYESLRQERGVPMTYQVLRVQIQG